MELTFRTKPINYNYKSILNLISNIIEKKKTLLDLTELIGESDSSNPSILIELYEHAFSGEQDNENVIYLVTLRPSSCKDDWVIFSGYDPTIEGQDTYKVWFDNKEINFKTKYNPLPEGV